jgi:hypothetical protein
MHKILITILVVSVSACGKDSSNSSKPQRTVDTVHTRPLEVTQKETVRFHRKKQMISRYNCKNELVSRKIETLNGLSKKITIDYENRKKVWSYSVHNRRTKSGNRGALVTDGKFVVDYAPTVFNMHVKSGINDVEYVFNRCTKIGMDQQGQRACLGIIELEKEGMIQIDVYYSSEVLPGEQHIRANCN